MKDKQGGKSYMTNKNVGKIFIFFGHPSHQTRLISLLLSSELKNCQKKATAKNVNKTFTKTVSLM